MTYWLFQSLLCTLVLSGLLVMTSRSPINSVIYLIVVYLAGGGLLLLMDHPFLGLTLVIIYVGAIAILFLFTVFMINLRASASATPLRGARVAFLAPALLGGIALSSAAPDPTGFMFLSDWSTLLTRPQDIALLGNMIFNGYPLVLLLVAYLLLLVMVAIIKLHLDKGNH